MHGILRYAQIEDYDVVSQIATELQNVHAKLRPDMYVFVKNYLEKYEFIEYLNSKRFVVFEDKEIKGIAIVTIKNIRGKKVFVIDGLGIKSDAQGKGYGSDFFINMVMLAKRKKCSKMELEVVYSNQNAVNFYKSMGMKKNKNKMEMVL